MTNLSSILERSAARQLGGEAGAAAGPAGKILRREGRAPEGSE